MKRNARYWVGDRYPGPLPNTDSVEMFARERIDVSAEKIHPSVLYDAYLGWCSGHSVSPVTPVQFSRELHGFGFRVDKRSGQRMLLARLLPGRD